MKFKTISVQGGKSLGAAELSTEGDGLPLLEFARLLLHQLRGGQTAVQYGANGTEPSAPFAFEVRLGVPKAFQTLVKDRAGRFFTMSLPNAARPYLLGLVVPRTEETQNDSDEDAIISVLGFSLVEEKGPIKAGGNFNALAVDMARHSDAIWDARPCVATTFMKVPTGSAAQGYSQDLADFSFRFASAFGAALLTEDAEDVAARDARGVSYLKSGPVADLFMAINHYVSTGDHPGTGNAFETSDPRVIVIAVPYRPTDPTDKRDFDLFNLRLAEIQSEGGPRVTWKVQGDDIDGLRPATFTIRRDRIESLTRHLREKPSKRGWGSPKPIVDIALGKSAEGDNR